MKIKLIYGTEMGTTKYIAELFKEELDMLGHSTVLFQAGIDGFQPVLDHDVLVIFLTPTYFGNKMAESMMQLIEVFTPDLSELKIASVCVGDSGYPNFCGAAETLENWIKKLQGKILLPTLKLDGYPKDLKIMRNWFSNLIIEERK